MIHIGAKEIGIIFAILIMDAALSADNSVAINALALNVAERLRSYVIWFGLGLAAILRVVALAFATFIIANPWVQVLGAFYLIYLFYGHFFKRGDDEETSVNGNGKFWATIIGIGFLDLSLSTDNIIAVVALSQNLYIVVIGVLASILFLAIASQVVRKVMKFYPSLEDAAYVILLFLAGIMLVGHFAETIVWIGQKLNINNILINKESISYFKYSVGEMLEIFGVGIIIAIAIFYDKMKTKSTAVNN